MGTRKQRQRQEELWYRRDLAEAPGHPFYQRLNEVLNQAVFDEFCEARCRKFYHEKLGRPSLAPGMYFRVMLIGFFEGIESERGIARRGADSLCLRQFLQIGLDERTPDHVTISRTRRLIDEATHQEVFGWVLRQVARAELLRGKTIGIDATTLEANAAMKSIVRRDTEESYPEYLKRLAEGAGLEATDEAALRRMDRRRKKKASNEEWVSPHDSEAEITRLKNGRTARAGLQGRARRGHGHRRDCGSDHARRSGGRHHIGRRDAPGGGRSGCRTDRRADGARYVQGECEGRGGVSCR
jgi:transposase